MEEEHPETVKKERDHYKKVVVGLAVLVVVAGVAAIGISQSRPQPVANVTSPPEVIDVAWFSSRYEQIQALDEEIRVAKEALQRHEDSVNERSGLFTISRKQDRDEEQQLNHNILRLEQERLRIINSYNSVAHIRSDVDLGELPREIDAKPGSPPRKKKGLLNRIFGRK